ncbi:MAG: hypothetical protein JWO03_815 [Bacteroidetes bacterium]|nr:hypothetical protein [Bacteroidota bacterium]
MDDIGECLLYYFHYLMKYSMLIFLFIPILTSAQLDGTYYDSDYQNEGWKRLVLHPDSLFEYSESDPPPSGCIQRFGKYGKGYYSITGDTVIFYFDNNFLPSRDYQIETRPPVSPYTCIIDLEVVDERNEGVIACTASLGKDSLRQFDKTVTDIDGKGQWSLPRLPGIQVMRLYAIGFQAKIIEINLTNDLIIKIKMKEGDGGIIESGTIRKYILKRKGGRYPVLCPIIPNKNDRYVRE